MSASAIVVMGVSGCGKSTVGGALAQRIGWRFADGDDFHPAANVAKMRAGQPLDDDDRAPWLASLNGMIQVYMLRKQAEKHDLFPAVVVNLDNVVQDFIKILLDGLSPKSMTDSQSIYATQALIPS